MADRWQGRQGNNGRRDIIFDTQSAGDLVVRGLSTFVRRNKVLTGSYVFGLLVLLLVGNGFQLTMEQRRKYDYIMSTVDVHAEYDAARDFHMADYEYRRTKGWFSCTGVCQRYKANRDRSKARLDAIRADGYTRMSDAKAVAGLFSEVGVGEAKDSFWERFQAGKNFAKRQSMWDLMFMGIRSMGRDENMMEYLLKVLMQVLINFSMGLVMSLVMFIFSLWSIIRSYQPNPIVAIAFFCSAVCAAFAFVASYLAIMFGAAAGGVYGLAKIAENNARIGGEGPGRRNVGNRPHYQ